MEKTVLIYQYFGGHYIWKGTRKENLQLGINLRYANKISIAVLLLSCVLTIKAGAQVFAPNGSNPHNFGLNLGFDNNLISVNLSYAYSPAKSKVSAFMDFTQGSSLIGTGDFRTQIGLQSWRGSFKKFILKNSIALVYAQSINKAGAYRGLGINLISNPGLKFNRFSIGADLQYNPFLATRIKHSDLYRINYFENVRDGWYSSTAENLRLGFYVGQQLGKKKTLEMNIRGGYQNNGEYDKLAPNAYAIIGINKSL